MKDTNKARTTRRRIERFVLALALLAPSSALAQNMEEGGSFVDDGSFDESSALPTGAEMDRPNGINDARARGQGIRIGQRTVAPRTIPPTYTVARGDTLWDITGHFYGDPFEWPRVWSYNPEITNPNWIYPLDQVRLVREGTQQVQLPSRHIARVERPASGPLEVYLREEGFVDPEELAHAGELVGSSSDHMLLTTYEPVYIKYSDDAPVPTVGEELSLFHDVSSTDRVDHESGVLVRIYGTVRIDSYDADEHMARATITEALDPIERGFHVARIPRRFQSVMPLRNQVDLSTTVVATLRPRSIIGEHQVIFLGAGSEDGVLPGNRFFIFESGDSWQQTVDDNTMDPGNSVSNPHPRGTFPDEVIAEVRVVAVQRHSSTAFVTMSLRETAIGARAQMRQGY